MEHAHEHHKPSVRDPARRRHQGPQRNAYLLAVVLEPGMDAAGVQAWLTQVTNLLGVLHKRDPEGTRVATATVAFSQTFFTASASRASG